MILLQIEMFVIELMNVYVINNYQESLKCLDEQIIKLKIYFVINVINILKVLNL